MGLGSTLAALGCSMLMEYVPMLSCAFDSACRTVAEGDKQESSKTRDGGPLRDLAQCPCVRLRERGMVRPVQPFKVVRKGLHAFPAAYWFRQFAMKSTFTSESHI